MAMEYILFLLRQSTFVSAKNDLFLRLCTIYETRASQAGHNSPFYELR